MEEFVAYDRAGQVKAETRTPAKLGLAASSVRTGPAEDSPVEDSAHKWEHIPRVYNRHLIRAVFDEQRMEQTKRRQSSRGTGSGTNRRWIEPPFDLDVLTDLLLENLDYFVVVDQLATDVVGLGYEIKQRKTPEIDRVTTDNPETSEAAGLEDAVDKAFLEQKRAAEKWLAEVCQDFQGNRITFGELLTCVLTDKESTGQGHVEVARDYTGIQLDPIEPGEIIPGVVEDRIAGVVGEPIAPEVPAAPPEFATGAAPIVGLYHVPARMIRRLDAIETPEGAKPRGFVQITNDGQTNAQTSYRPWLSDPKDPDYRFTQRELIELKAHDSTIDAELGTPIEEGMPKNELVDFKYYHSAEVHYGVPKVIAALAAIYGQIYSEARNLRFFVNRGVPDWVVSIEADNATLIDETPGGGKEQVEAFEKLIEEHMKHLIQGEDHRTLIVKIPRDQIEAKWERLIDPLRDQDHQVYELRNRDKVIRAYRVLPHRIGIIETASLGTGTGETQEETYKRAQIDPRQKKFEDFARQLFDEMGWHMIELKFQDLDVTDEEREVGIFERAWNTHVLSINEAREWLSDIRKEKEYHRHPDPIADIPWALLEAQNGGPITLPSTMMGLPGADESPRTASPSGEPRALRSEPQTYQQWSRLQRERLERKRETVARRLKGNGRHEAEVPASP